MEPNAYVLRDHTVFNSPLPVDRTRSKSIPTPEAWAGQIEQETVDVLPLVKDPNAAHQAGWCTYAYEQSAAPELEIICGGVNTKTPKASAVWRQGFLMHFGFEPAPSELNENGAALLINSICYIAGFRADRPNLRTPSVFYSGVRCPDRRLIDRLVRNPERDLHQYLGWYVEEKTAEQLSGMSRAEVGKWYKENGEFLRADSGGKLVVDEDAKKFGVATNTLEFVDAALAAVKTRSNKTPLARKLLGTYVPNGPGADADFKAWDAWFAENRPYLFFTDTGGFQWVTDHLAKTVGTPTRSLRDQRRVLRIREMNSSKSKPSSR